MNEWLSEIQWMTEWMKERMNVMEWMKWVMNERMNEWRSWIEFIEKKGFGWMSEWMTEWMKEWRNDWMNELMNQRTIESVKKGNNKSMNQCNLPFAFSENVLHTDFFLWKWNFPRI